MPYIETQEAGNAIALVLRPQFYKRRTAYEAISLFEPDDLSQEVWFRLLEEGTDVAPDWLPVRAVQLAESIARTGRHRRGILPFTPYANLSDNERIEYDNKAYAVREGAE